MTTVATRAPRGRSLALVVAILAAIWFGGPPTAWMLSGVYHSHLNDFGRLYYSARQSAAGRSMYAESPVQFWERGPQPMRNLNPPHAHLPMLVLAPFSEGTVFVVGLLTAWLALGWCLRAGLVAAGLDSWLLVAAVALATPLLAPGQAVLGTGQFFAWWLAVPATLAWRAARDDRWTTSGFWLGTLAGAKPFALLFLPYLLIARRWRAALTMVATIVAWVACGVVVFGWRAYAEWIQTVTQATWIGNQLNASLVGACARLFAGVSYHPFAAEIGALTTYAPVWSAGWLAQPLANFLRLAALAATFLLARRASVDRAFALLILAALLVSPLGSTYYVWLATGPLVVLIARDRVFRVAALAALPFLLIPTSMIEAAQPHAWATLLLANASCSLVLGLWAAVAVSARRAARSGVITYGLPIHRFTQIHAD